MAGFILCRSKTPGKRARLVPIKIGPHVGAALAAFRADELVLKIAQPEIVRPLVGADRRPLTAIANLSLKPSSVAPLGNMPPFPIGTIKPEKSILPPAAKSTAWDRQNDQCALIAGLSNLGSPAGRHGQAYGPVLTATALIP
jgi:hypothetical protein